ncbi:MAG TPA: glycosyltransferase [Thermoanaerobaculia bacterium]|nr:glycosyltransferase [Thermoanaerobaculia bacterium]
MQAVIVVPCYNEADRLDTAAFLRFDGGEYRARFCFVDDGSTDGTGAVIGDLVAADPSRFMQVTLERNRGKAEAVRRGILEACAANPEYVGFWDADLATPLSELPLFFDVLAEQPQIEMVYGARVRLLGRSISRNPARHYFGRVGATLISRTLGLAVYDTQCGAKLFRVNDTIRKIFVTPFVSKWIFDVEIIARFIEQRGRDDAARAIYELPLRIWRDVKGSKVKSTDFLRALRELRKIDRAYRKRE